MEYQDQEQEQEQEQADVRSSQSKIKAETAALSSATHSDEKTQTATDNSISLTEEPTSEIAAVINKFIGLLRGIGHTAEIALPHIANWEYEERMKVTAIMDRFLGSDLEQVDIGQTIQFESVNDLVEFTDAFRHIEATHGYHAPDILAQSLFTQLFAQFDAFIGGLLKAIYLKNESLLNDVSRQISLSELLNYKDLSDVKLFLIEKEIDSFRRGSYIDQFSTLSNKFKLELKKFSEWPDFVELGQRRNILIHNGGLVNDQYLNICKNEKYQFKEEPELGTSVKMSFAYFRKALNLVSKVGLMLGYTLWSKIFPDEKESLHEALNEVLYTALYQQRWSFVADLGDFVLSEPMKKNSSDIKFRIRVVNVAIGYKFGGRPADATKLLSSIDWSASYRDFKLAKAILNDDFESAIEIMKGIGPEGELLQQHSYHTWPLFHKFREREDFYKAYFEIYGRNFSETFSTPKGSFEVQAKETPSLEQHQKNSAATHINRTELTHEHTSAESEPNSPNVSGAANQDEFTGQKPA